MDKINVFYGQDQILMPKTANFTQLKKEILFKDKRFIKSFSYKGNKINESLLVIDYPTFSISIDNNKFNEYKKGQYRCSKCRKYLKINKWNCRHTKKCRAYYIFKLKKSETSIIEGRYSEPELEDEKVIDNILNPKIEKIRNSMINRINFLLNNNSNK